MAGTTQRTFTPNWLQDLNFAFSRKADGQMSFHRAPIQSVNANRRRFLSRQLLPVERLVAGELVHSAQVAVVDASHCGRGALSPDWIPGVDGLVTDSNNILLLTTHADCAPLLLYNPEEGVLAQAHAGWRGLASGIVPNLAAGLRSLCRSGDDTIFAWIGPTIGACCYRVGLEAAERFPADCVHNSDGELYLDLSKFIVAELIMQNIQPENIFPSNICTSCNEEFASYRRDGESVVAMACVCGLK